MVLIQNLLLPYKINNKGMKANRFHPHNNHVTLHTRLLPGASTQWTQPNVSGHESDYCKKGKVFPYSLPSVGPGADPGVQTVNPQVT